MTEAIETKAAPNDDAVTFQSVVAAYRARTFAPREVTFPGDEGTRLRVRLLTERELDKCRIGAVSYVKEHRVDTVVDRDDTLERERIRQIIWNAFIATADVKGEQVRFFATPSDVRDTLDPTTIDRLYEIYLNHQAEIADAAVPSEETLEKAIDTALAGTEHTVEFFLRALNGPGLRAVAALLFARLRQERRG